ncbi:MAG: hypothetical protein KF709_11770 [Gemmatimonadaceae bacterium]|nr:hypothetical protein [Gemmatimonadaceae bacterium]
MLAHLRTFLILLLLALGALGCRAEQTLLPPPAEEPALDPLPTAQLDGSWRAIYWLVTYPNGDVVDVWELGGRLELQIEAAIVSGTLFVPGEVTNGIDARVDMQGLALAAGDSATFAQVNDTFVGRAKWRIGDDFLTLVDHPMPGGARFTVVLVRGW